MYIHAYTPARGLIRIIYTSYVLCSPEERFNSTNNESISSDCYRRIKFSAKILFTSVFVPHLTTNLSTIMEKQSFHFVQSLLPFAVKVEILIHHSCDLTLLPTVASKHCRITWQRDTVSTKHSYRFLLYNMECGILV